MADQINIEEGNAKKVTAKDILIAQSYYPILISYAMEMRMLSYGLLTTIAKEENVDKPYMKAAIAVQVGHHLKALRSITKDEHDDLSCLVVNKSTGECGDPYDVRFNAEEARKKIFEFTKWEDVLNKLGCEKVELPLAEIFGTSVPKQSNQVKNPTNSQVETAGKEWFDFYKLHKPIFDDVTQEQKLEITKNIAKGMSLRDAIKKVLNRDLPEST